MPRDKNKPKHIIAKTGPKLTQEQQELLDSGLAMLAHMIVETHLKRIKSDPDYRNQFLRQHNTDTEK